MRLLIALFYGVVFVVVGSFVINSTDSELEIFLVLGLLLLFAPVLGFILKRL